MTRTHRYIADSMTEAARALAELRQHINERPARALLPDDTRDTLAGRVAEAAARISGGEYRPPYSGWKNRETWNASLWINNDQAMQESALATMRDAINGADWDSRNSRDLDMERTYLLNVAADALREWWTHEALAETDNAPPDSGPVADAWQYAAAVVNWREIAETLAEGQEIDHLPPERS